MQRYINEFVGLTCAPLLLSKSIYPNAKEITESMGMYNAVRKHIRSSIGISFSDKDVNVIVVGDGHTPRTAALFATRSKWTTYSIDPLLKTRDWGIRRMVCMPQKVQDVNLQLTGKTILILPHAHVNISDCLSVVPNPSSIVALPCCFPIT